MSSSTRDVPISKPLAFKKVFAIPPPTSTLSDFDNKLVITSNFVETFDPQQH
ncbi:MAG: hypothetical protein CM15mP22_5010 [Gammaproteobacteria bacterium]|nr:MAG: hypothetical protein CM15mP22_5010 [Gammaproteobacteria bacterium]